jgi:three-Cys-motif partner protein
MSSVKRDEIGSWSEVKLEIVKEYATAYSSVISARREIRKHIYIDAFAGAGVHLSKRTHDFVPGSPLNAVAVVPPFKEIHLVDLDGERVEELRRLTSDEARVQVHEGDANELLLKIFERCRYYDYARGLCLLDPYKLAVDWRVLETAGKMGSIEVFYVFMIMDANRNVFLRRRQDAKPEQLALMSRIWGDDSWQEIAYTKTPLFQNVEEKASNEAIAEGFRKRLQKVAGFK